MTIDARQHMERAFKKRYEVPVERLAEMIRDVNGRGVDPARALARRMLAGAYDVHVSWPGAIHRFVREHRSTP